jgi:3',5'-cyclic-AMP phosphodiesterase
MCTTMASTGAGFLQCMARAGTGLVWTMSGGIPVSQALAKIVGRQTKSSDLTFVQISDSHAGFNTPANTDVVGTLKTAIDQINGLATQP